MRIASLLLVGCLSFTLLLTSGCASESVPDTSVAPQTTTNTTSTPPVTTSLAPTTEDPPTTIPPTTVSAPEPVTESAEGIPAARFVWTFDPGIRLENAGIPFAMHLDDGRIRLYYAGLNGIESAISDDGLNFEKEPGVRITPGAFDSLDPTAADPTLVRLPDGDFRMYYKGAVGQGGPGQAIHRIFSAYSPDGLEFTREGLRIDSTQTPDNGWASVPDAIILPDGSVRIYYCSNGDDADGIVSAVSEDGFDFTWEGLVLRNFADPSVIRLDNGDYLMIAVDFSNGAQGIYSFISGDGINFTGKEIVIARANTVDPAIIQLSDDTFRVYYWKADEEPAAIYSMTGKITLQ